MRTNINLATLPYEDAKQYLTRWGTAVVLLCVATAALVFYTIHTVRMSADINRQLSQMRQKIERLDQEQRSGERMLALPENRGTVGKSQYLNTILARKAFSWTTVFSDMEKIMPPGLRVLSISPTLDENNQLQVHILVGGENRARAIQLVQNLEKMPRFRNVQLRSDVMTSVQEAGTGSYVSSEEGRDPIRFDIVSDYLPPTQKPEAPATTAEAQPAPVTGARP
ncbi:MAG TPA: hypothetical protein VGL89_08430 [Candidatus Koribacter sp.]|jgi:type IV pilus assembly protein PilN